MIKHKVKIVSLSVTDLIKAAFQWAAVGKLDITSMNTVSLPYYFTVIVESAKILPQEAGNTRIVRSKELDEILNKTDLPELREMTKSYGVKDNTPRLDITRLVKQYCIE